MSAAHYDHRSGGAEAGRVPSHFGRFQNFAGGITVGVYYRPDMDSQQLAEAIQAVTSAEWVEIYPVDVSQAKGYSRTYGRFEIAEAIAERVA